MASTGFHESEDTLRPATRDMHRAVVSLMEELEAIDWYQQRIDATGDSELQAILAHNRDEEIEHAAMLLEWLRRHEAAFDARLRRFLFSEGALASLEEDSAPQSNGVTNREPGPSRPGFAAMALGSLRRER
jgi:ferritin-like protein